MFEKYNGAVTALATVVIGILTCLYVTESKRANALTQQALVLGQRAYLSYGDIDQIPSGIKIHISNFGHVPAKIIGGAVRYQHNTYSDNRSLTDIARNVRELTVQPGALDTVILLDLPKLAPDDFNSVESGHQILGITGHLKYDTGFDSTDELLIAIAYDWEKKHWFHTGEGRNIDFTRPEVPGR